MKTTTTKSLLWLFLLIFIMGGVNTNIRASGCPTSIALTQTAFFEGGGPAPLPPSPPQRL